MTGFACFACGVAFGFVAVFIIAFVSKKTAIKKLNNNIQKNNEERSNQS